MEVDAKTDVNPQTQMEYGEWTAGIYKHLDQTRIALWVLIMVEVAKWLFPL